MPDHNQQHQRRPHYHRSRRGPDRRGGERRLPPPQPEQAARDQLDVEQIMRDIRSRIAERQGIDLSSQQIQELASRRLEAILDPRTIKPSLMDELRRAAGMPADEASPEAETEAAVDESRLYESSNGLLRALRRLLSPILKLFINPSAIVETFSVQERRAREAAARQEEHRRRQAEWNALHFEILRRLVTDIARAEIDNQHLSHRIESLMARVDFNERRVRGLEHVQHQSRPAGRTPDAVAPPALTPAPREESASAEHLSPDVSLEGGRRRRRRRRGRRSGQPRDLTGAPMSGQAGSAANQPAEGDDFIDEDAMAEDPGEDVVSQMSSAAGPAAEEFEAPAGAEDPLPVESSELTPVPAAPDSSSAPAPLEPSERRESPPPEHS